MGKKQQAAESYNIDQARDLLSTSVQWAAIVLERLSPFLPQGRLKILEIGAAQGRTLIGLAKLNHEACGIEPYIPAIEIARDLAVEEQVDIDIREGRAEEIPFPANMFDLVLAFSVMEHVEDLDASLQEISRVIKPGGIFWFNSASAMCPSQGEIRGFPLFGWYPDKIKKGIMRWAVIKRPELVGFTEHPAIHWWTPYNARRRLANAGFDQVWDRWDLRLPSEGSGISQSAANLAKRFDWLRLPGDIVYSGCSYAARKEIVLKF
jgi:SAM-dependent methyltransferase